MQEVIYFKKEELEEVALQRKKTLLIYIITSVLYLVISVGCILWHISLPYGSEKITTIKLIHYPITGIFIIYSMLYLGICYRRVNKYYKVLFDNYVAEKDVNEGSFLEYRKEKQVKEGVEFKSIIFIEYNKYKNDYFERKVLVPFEKEFPKFEESQFVKYYTQNNVLIKYETE